MSRFFRPIALPALAAALVGVFSLWSSLRPAFALQVPLTIEQLTAMSDRVVTGQVVGTFAQRDNNGRGIHTHVIVYVHDHIKGKPDVTSVEISVPGGTVDDLTMRVDDTPEFSRDESVMVFLKENDDGTYDVVGWEQGKLEVHNGLAHSHASGFTARAGDLAREIHRILAAQGNEQPEAVAVEQSVAAWAQAAVEVKASASVDTFVSNNAKWPNGTMTYLVNPANGDLDPNSALSAIQAATGTWTSVSTANFKFVYGGATSATSIDPNSPNGQNQVIFVTQTQNGTLATTTWWMSGTNPDGTSKIIETDMVINDAYVWSNTPTGSAFDLQSVTTHEFGHMLSLGHDSDSNAVMYYAIPPATIKRVLYTTDIQGINYLYPNTNPLPTATPTKVPPTATPTATRTPLPPTSTPTRTPVPPTATRTPVPPTATPTATATMAAYCKADVNGDHVITMIDVDAISAAWHSTNPADLQKYDINRDGRITGDDVAIASGNLNKTC